jgi:hypothetical protein
MNFRGRTRPSDECGRGLRFSQIERPGNAFQLGRTSVVDDRKVLRPLLLCIDVRVRAINSKIEGAIDWAATQ